MVYIIPNFLVLHFGEKFMKIQTNIAKLQMNENLHKNHVNENMFHSHFCANFHEFYEGHMLQLYTANFLVFNPFKMAVQFI